MGDSREPVTIFLPTWNGGARLDAVLAAVRGQRTERSVELRAIDSSSSDGSREVLARHGVEFTQIPKAEFGHGRTRNRGVRECRTDLVVLLSQDARPADERWLDELLAPFADPRVAGAFSRQIPRPECHPFQRLNLEAHAAAAERWPVVELASPAEWRALSPAERVERLTFDNVSSAVRRSVVERVPFPDVPFGEDIAWARDVLLAGHRLAFASNSRVEHSHGVSRAEFFQRVVETHAARRRLTDHDPLPGVRAWWQRAWASTVAFHHAAGITPGLSERDRSVAKWQAFPYALLQAWAIRRGARLAAYEPPA
jgi:rhamnosyltransferase